MSSTAELLLGVIALAVAVMAIVQVGAIVAGLRVARRVEHMASEFETNVKPLLANLTSLGAEATKAATVAAAQVERLDRIFSDVVTRVDSTLGTAQAFIAGPVKDGMAIVAGIRAAMNALKSFREMSRRRHAARSVVLEDEDESLFIG